MSTGFKLKSGERKAKHKMITANTRTRILVQQVLRFLTLYSEYSNSALQNVASRPDSEADSETLAMIRAGLKLNEKNKKLTDSTKTQYAWTSTKTQPSRESGPIC